jgi:hypothetical protein
LFKLFSDFRGGNPPWTQEEVRELRFDLEKYGRFMNIPLYPRGLFNEIDEFFSLQKQFYENLENIEGLASKQIEKSALHKDALWDYLGLSRGSSRSTYAVDIEEQHKEIAHNLRKEQPQLISNTRDLFAKMEILETEISEGFEDFFKSNNLKLEEESTNPFR